MNTSLLRLLGRSLLTALSLSSVTSVIAGDTLHLDLESCILRAKRDGIAARALRFDYASQKADHDASLADYLPQLSLDASIPGYSRAIVPVLQPDGTYQNLEQSQMYSDAALSLNQKIPFTGGDISISSSLNNRTNLAGDRLQRWNSTPFSVQLRQPISGYNSYSFTRRLDDLRFEQHSREYIEQMEALSAQAAGRFFDYYIACMNEDNARLNIALNDSIHALAKGRYNVGKIAENDLLQNELAVLSARSDFERTKRTRERSLAALQLLLGLSTTTSIVAQTPPAAKEINIDISKVVDEAMTHRSELSLYTFQNVEAERSLELAKVNNRFSASINASYGLNQSAGSMSDAYKTLLEQDRLTLSLELPLITWGKTSSQVDAASYAHERMKSYNALRLEELRQEIEFDLRDFLQLADLLGISDRSQSIAARRYEVARNRYIIGKIETTELMLAQKEKDEARKTYFSTLRDYWVGYYTIRKTTQYDLEKKRSILSSDED